MWKCVSRGVRESLERGLGFSWSRGNRQEPPGNQQCSKFTSFCRTASRARVCSTVRWPQCRQQSQGSSGTSPPNEEEPSEQDKHHFTHDPKDCILGAFSCSSALVLGWVLTQPYYHWRKWWSKERSSLHSHCPLAKAILAQHRDPVISCRIRLYDPLTSLLRGLNLSRLLPVNLAAPNNYPVLLSNSIDYEDSKQQEIEYGPITAEQALDEAAEDVRMAHDRALSVSENRRGVDAAARHRHAKAVALFRAASAKSYAPAQYNLAQCYELGLGTKQDFSQAAEWYKKAAELGHAGAMYNLAVFHAHGWGGLEADIAQAKKLLVKAAEKGQPDAMAALGYPGQPPPPSITSIIDKEDLWASSSEADEIPEEPSDSCHHFSNNPIALYNLAQSFENSSNDSSPDPYLIMDLYKFASELGHSAAKARLQILQTYDAVGLLSEFLFMKNNFTENMCEADLILEP